MGSTNWISGSALVAQVHCVRTGRSASWDDLPSADWRKKKRKEGGETFNRQSLPAHVWHLPAPCIVVVLCSSVLTSNICACIYKKTNKKNPTELLTSRSLSWSRQAGKGGHTQRDLNVPSRQILTCWGVHPHQTKEEQDPQRKEQHWDHRTAPSTEDGEMWTSDRTNERWSRAGWG